MGSTPKARAASIQISSFIPSLAMAEIMAAISVNVFFSSGENPSMFLDTNFTGGPIKTETKAGA